MLLPSTIVLAALALGGPSTAPAMIAADTLCPVKPDHVPVEGRISPIDSLTFRIDDHPVKVCYGRPSARGRTMLGGARVPYGKLWRTGANEPTVFFTPIALSIAGLAVPPGLYSLYTVPGETTWEIIVNRSVSQWGHENAYTEKVKAQELGRATVKRETIETPVETFTIRAEPSGTGATALLLEWEKTRVRIPVAIR